jgi:RNA polymerase sigma factor (sigma-70 family)
MPHAYSEDIIEDTLEQALLCCNAWDKVCQLDTWLFGIYKHLSAQRFKKKHIHNRYLNYKISYDPDEKAYDPFEEITELKFNTAWLDECYSKEREILEMYLQGKNIKEIADILGKKPDCVKSVKYKAIGQLRERAVKEYEAQFS